MTEATDREVQPATAGKGPLLQRDYWAVIADARMSPREIAALIAEKFPEFPPESLVRFQLTDGCKVPLSVGDELDIHIKLAGQCAVRVLHRDENSITLATLEGHPEAGRITFGAYRNDRDEVVFHIRSRARSSGLTKFVEFLVGGDPMQTTTWVDFINAVATRVGSGVREAIRVEQQSVEEQEEDADPTGPTFIARGD